MKIDLHIHTTNSDGSYTTQEIICMLSDLDADLISITDHDSVESYYDLLALKKMALPKPMQVIPGVELCFSYHGVLRDMLAYGFDLEVIRAYLNERYTMTHRLEKQTHILEQLKEICQKQGLELEKELTCYTGNKAEGFKTVYQSLLKFPQNAIRCPAILNIAVFYWDYFSNRESPFFVDETYDLPDMKAIIELIHGAGGKAFLAHPCLYRLSSKLLDFFVMEAIQNGVDGLEVYHSSNKGEDIAIVQSYIQKYDLLISGGSDFHGSVKPKVKLLVGEDHISIPYDEIREWTEEMKTIMID